MMIRTSLVPVLATCVLLTGCKSEAPKPAPAPSVAAPSEVAPAAPKPTGAQDVRSLQEATAPKTLAGLPETRVTPTMMAGALREKIRPDEAGVRTWLLQNRSALVTDVKMRKVSLDDDPQDEYLAVIPFSPKAGEAYEWILLIDGQKDHSVVAKDWTRRKVDTKAHVVAHGKGGGPVVVATVTYQDRSSVEIWRMQKAGNVSSLGSYGTEPGERARFEAPKTIVVKRDGGGEDRIELVTTDKGFDLVSPPPQ